VLQSFAENGLHFSCRACSTCCRHDPGFVFLTRNDVDALTTALETSYDDFVLLYCRWIPSDGGKEVLCLKERANYDCILWKNVGCSVYASRPIQCRTFPFWQSVLASRAAWDATASDCPGMNDGEFRGPEEIEQAIALRDNEAFVYRYVR
jgi:uncharacterized protein